MCARVHRRLCPRIDSERLGLFLFQDPKDTFWAHTIHVSNDR